MLQLAVLLLASGVCLIKFHTLSFLADDFNCWLFEYFNIYYLLFGQLSVVLLVFVWFIFDL